MSILEDTITTKAIDIIQKAGGQITYDTFVEALTAMQLNGIQTTAALEATGIIETNFMPDKSLMISLNEAQ
ncbi:MAG: hypothetical protein HQK59_01745 [Deltaproteobacteria bacterium]|nr:hypothetical protein [Deltaproteobacteria bacterium]